MRRHSCRKELEGGSHGTRTWFPAASLVHKYCYYVDGLTERFHMSEAEKLKSVPLAQNGFGTSRNFSSSFECKLY